MIASLKISTSKLMRLERIVFLALHNSLANPSHNNKQQTVRRLFRTRNSIQLEVVPQLVASAIRRVALMTEVISPVARVNADRVINW